MRFLHPPLAFPRPILKLHDMRQVLASLWLLAVCAAALADEKKDAAPTTPSASTPTKTKPAVPPDEAGDKVDGDKSDTDKPAKEVTGKEIYRFMCADCHGDHGQGVAGEHDEPLYGDRSLADLTKIIDETMPFDEPEILSAEESKKVAEHIYETFYTAAARTKNKPARIELSRLTVRQYQQSVADLIGSFREPAKSDDGRGLPGAYYITRNFGRDKKVLDRTDPTDRIRLWRGTLPTPEMPGEEFSIRWQGSLIVEETGDYEFAVKTQNGVRLWVNDDDKALIDGWVSSGAEPREHTATLRLLGGRAYPLRLDVFKYKDKSASIGLRWMPPAEIVGDDSCSGTSRLARPRNTRHRHALPARRQQHRLRARHVGVEGLGQGDDRCRSGDGQLRRISLG